MSDCDHYEGFEKEAKFSMIAGQASCDCPVLKRRTVRRIIAHVAPDFLEGLFEIRPCRRKLRYIGCRCEEIECSHGEPFFEIGEIYESISFNGATYSIEVYCEGERRIGSAYFEWIKD